VTFGSTQLRNCSVSSGSSRSSTSGSCSSRQCDVFNTGKSLEATQTRSSSISEVEDFRGFPQSRSKNSRSDIDPVMIGRCKKAKITREVGVCEDESPFVHLAGRRSNSNSFASVEQSLTETDADDDHFWSKISSPEHEKSFVRYEVDDIESPLSGINENRSSCSMSSFLKTNHKPTLWPLSWQADSNRDNVFRDEQTSEDPFEQQNSVQCVSALGAVCTQSGTSGSNERVAASNLQSVRHQRETYTNNTRSITSDVRDQRSEPTDKAASTARSSKWWAFVSGITSALSPPGQLI